MQKELSISLFDAFQIAVERIRGNYDKDWLIIGDPEDNCLKLFTRGMYSIDEYEIISEPHHHSFTEICICLRGKGAMQYEECLFEVNEGDVCLILPGVIHNELPRKDCDYITLWISLDSNRTVPHIFGGSYEEGFFDVDGFSVRHDYDNNKMIHWIKEETSYKLHYYKDLIKAHLLKIIVNTVRRIDDTRVNRPNKQLWKEFVVTDVQKYIDQHYLKNPRLTDISQEVCISVNYLNTIFKSIVGKTIVQYIEEFKVNKAKNLIRNTYESINSIANLLGYYDQYHFSKIFKKETGYTPTQYRNLRGEFPSEK